MLDFRNEKDYDTGLKKMMTRLETNVAQGKELNGINRADAPLKFLAGANKVLN